MAADEERTIFDVCMDFGEAAEADADGGDDATKAALLGLLAEVGALLKATADDEDREMFVGEDGVQHTVAALGRHAADAALVGAGWAALGAACVRRPEHRRLVRAEGGIALLVKALADHAADGATVRGLLGAAAQLCVEDDQNKAMLHVEGVTEQLLAALEAFADDAAVLEATLETLIAMLRDDGGSQEGESFRGIFIGELKEKDILNILIELVEAEPADPVLACVLRALSLICRSTEMAEEAVDNGVVDLALGLLRDKGDAPAVLRPAAQLLKVLCQTNEAGKESLVAENAEDLLLAMLRAHTGEAGVIEAGMVVRAPASPPPSPSLSLSRGRLAPPSRTHHGALLADAAGGHVPGLRDGDEARRRRADHGHLGRARRASGRSAGLPQQLHAAEGALPRGGPPAHSAGGGHPGGGAHPPTARNAQSLCAITLLSCATLAGQGRDGAPRRRVPGVRAGRAARLQLGGLRARHPQHGR
jgi:hypothetical protein